MFILRRLVVFVLLIVFVISGCQNSKETLNSSPDPQKSSDYKSSSEYVDNDENKNENVEETGKPQITEEKSDQNAEDIVNIIIENNDVYLVEKIISIARWFEQSDFLQSREQIVESDTFVVVLARVLDLRDMYNHTKDQNYSKTVTDYFNQINKKYNEDKWTNKESMQMIYELSVLLEDKLELPNEENESEDHPLKVVASTKNFNLYNPQKNEELYIEEGFSFHGEIHKQAIGNIEVEIIDMDGNVLDRVEINENWFDDGVDLEWTYFALRMQLKDKPQNNKGIFRILDHKNNEKIEIPVSFVKVDDCSNLKIPNDKEVNTSIDKVNKIIKASWYDDNISDDVTVTIRYTDDNCTQSVNKLVFHTLF